MNRYRGISNRTPTANSANNRASRAIPSAPSSPFGIRTTNRSPATTADTAK
ncbi:hypothetical protein [Nocardia seriolae]|uniref:hypothetical protein n=1 Tax=Nocardia seriolae TaxID=37332 RepID=UPI0029535AAA|nr:hypothetical protein [Nocardia seriolae]